MPESTPRKGRVDSGLRDFLIRPNGETLIHYLLPAPGHTFGKMLATGFIKLAGKSTIGAPGRQMQIDRCAKHLRQIRATLPGFTDRYKRQLLRERSSLEIGPALSGRRV